MPEHDNEPTPPERARTALAVAGAATLVTHGCPHRPRTVTLVDVQDQPDGCPLISLEGDSPTIGELTARPVGTLSVGAAPGFRRLDLTGTFRSCRAQRPGYRTYRLSPLSARLVGTSSLPILVNEFLAARPDPLIWHAAALLEHLADAHASEFLACLRAQGHRDAEAVVPRLVDRYGIDAVVLGPPGVQRVRLAFPNGPIESLAEVPPGHLMGLLCGCEGIRRRTKG